MKFCEPRNKRRKTIIGKCCRPELKGKLTSVANRLQPRSLCSQHSRRNVRLTEPILTWPLEGGALINSAMLGDADVLYFCSSFLSTLEDRVNQFCKGAQEMSQIWFHRGFHFGSLQVGELCPLDWPFWAESARPALIYLQDFDFTSVLHTWWHLNHLGSVLRSSSCQSPPSWLPCPVGWGEVGEASVGKTSLGMGGTSHCSCRAVWGYWLENSGSGSQDVVGTVKTLDCFLHFSAEVATTDLWA